MFQSGLQNGIGVRGLKTIRIKAFKWGFVLLLLVIVAGFLVPENPVIPVRGATSKDWNHRSFWHHPWGKSGVHKGIDIFAAKETPVISAGNGLVIQTGEGVRSGKTVTVLGPKWRFHYYGHMSKVDVNPFQRVAPGERLGLVGDTGNAAGKSPHLHYTIFTLVPYPWRLTFEPQGWKKMFFLNPHAKLIHLSR